MNRTHRTIHIRGATEAGASLFIKFGYWRYGRINFGNEMHSFAFCYVTLIMAKHLYHVEPETLLSQQPRPEDDTAKRFLSSCVRHQRAGGRPSRRDYPAGTRLHESHLQLSPACPAQCATLDYRVPL